MRRAAAKAGRSVLQLDPSAHYGGPWASYHLEEFMSLLEEFMSLLEEEGTAAATASAGVGGAAVYRQPGAELGPAHQYNLDLAPKVRGLQYA